MTAVIGILTAAVLLILGVFARSWWRLRGARVITCPENRQCAGVKVDAVYGTLTGSLRLQDCTRWPEKAGCGQDCLAQIEAAQDGCLVRSIIARWYEGKSCVCCGKALWHGDWLEHRPALRDPGGKTIEWIDVRPEQVPQRLATCQPVCWSCLVAERFRQEHPELIVERPRR
jgi:hypothetical protein